MYYCIQTLYKITSERGQPLYKGQNAGSQSMSTFRDSTVTCELHLLVRLSRSPRAASASVLCTINCYSYYVCVAHAGESDVAGGKRSEVRVRSHEPNEEELDAFIRDVDINYQK